MIWVKDRDREWVESGFHQGQKPCIQKSQESYKDNIFTTGLLGWPGVNHIQGKDFTQIIDKALAMEGLTEVDVNELPLSMILSWYEQKAWAILYTLLYLGIRDIRLGPSLPAFVSENVLNVLVENFNIMPVNTPEEDLKAILGE